MVERAPDPAQQIITTVTDALAEFFRPDSAVPPLVGGTTNVRFFAGDGAPLAAWDSHASQGCAEPFVWVRAMRRYRSKAFPTQTIGAAPCDLTKVIAVEIGVGWCAYVPEPDRVRMADYAEEARVSMDVAWRVEETLCAVAKRLSRDDSERLVGTDTIIPYGPEGGVIAWTAVLYASY